MFHKNVLALVWTLSTPLNTINLNLDLFHSQVIAQKGITFDQFACLAACNNLSVETVRGTQADGSEDAFRRAVTQHTSRSDRVVVASYSRKDLKQTGDGHFSPIGGE
jgi:glutathione gamma-glutamylcysteinyltransferase